MLHFENEEHRVLQSIEDVRYSTVRGKSPIDAAAVHFAGGKQGDIL